MELHRLQFEAVESADLDSFQSLWKDEFMLGEHELISELVLHAVKMRSTNILKYVVGKLTNGQLLNKIGSDGYNPLCVASSFGDAETVKLLLNCGAEPNATMPSGVSALHIATIMKHHKVVQLLLKHHAMVDDIDQNGQTALMYASSNSDVRIVSMLIQSGAKVNLRNLEGMSALMFAAQNGSTEVVQLLLSHDATASLANNEGNDARYIAILANHAAVAEMISFHRHYTTQDGDKHRSIVDLLWIVLCYVLTLGIPPFILSLAGWKTQQAQMAWREKIMFCELVLLISAGFAFMTFGLQRLICSPLVPITLYSVQNEFSQSSATREKLVVIRGTLYDVGDFTKFNSHPPGGPKAQPPVINYIGTDASGLFPLPQSSCPRVPIKQGCIGKECHDMSTWDVLESLNSRRRVAYSWDLLQTSNRFLMYKDLIYDVGTYFSDGDLFLGPELSSLLQENIGRDASKDLQNFRITKQQIECMKENMLVGQIEGLSTGCFASQISVALLIAIFVAVMMTKFVGAMVYTTSMSLKIKQTQAQKDKLASYVLILVPCYSEGTNAIEKTLKSIVSANYNDNQKLVMMIADGVVTGSGNAKPTAEIALDFIDLAKDMQQGAISSYHSVSHEQVTLNRAKVFAGTIKTETHRKVSIILVSKIGNIDEESMPKAGNRGKRDSQLILMSLLSRSLLNERMSPLEYKLFCHVRKLSNVYLDRFDLVLMIDSDTVIDSESIPAMVKCMETFPKVMALCGETRLSNRFESLTSMIQVMEYYQANFLGKAFESLFGGVTCLPGCMSMFKIRQANTDGSMVPLLANPDLVEQYSSCDTASLHRKNLLLLGEDRYLTTLLLQHFPRKDTIFLPDAFCYTTVPASLPVLLSQRRRWVNSTIHNLWELMFVNKLCGIFCFSMQFVVLLDLIGTILSPVSVATLIYIAIDLGTNGLSQTAILPLAFMVLVYGLQALLVFIPFKSPLNLLWMAIFLLATPVWQLLIPLNSFWQMDNFSWGSTHTIAPINKKLNVTEDHPEQQYGNNPNRVQLKKWHEWHALSKKNV